MTAKRRKYSEMTHADAVRAVSEFAAKVKRWVETSESIDRPEPNPNQAEILVKILIDGQFGSASPFFEGMRVLGGHKLPAKEQG